MPAHACTVLSRRCPPPDGPLLTCESVGYPVTGPVTLCGPFQFRSQDTVSAHLAVLRPGGVFDETSWEEQALLPAGGGLWLGKPITLVRTVEGSRKWPKDGGPTMPPAPARLHPDCNALPTYALPVGESSPFFRLVPDPLRWHCVLSPGRPHVDGSCRPSDRLG